MARKNSGKNPHGPRIRKGDMRDFRKLLNKSRLTPQEMHVICKVFILPVPATVRRALGKDYNPDDALIHRSFWLAMHKIVGALE